METNKEKGDNYECQVRDYIRTILKKSAYLWDDTPETLLIKAGIIGSHNENRLKRKENKENPLQDTGVDIIQVENENICSFVQCKNGYKSGVTYDDLAGFLMWMMSFENTNGYVYYTSKLSTHIQSLPKNKRIEYIKLPYIQNIVEDKKMQSIKPYEYQIKAKENCIEYFKKNDRGILSMPCGTGKTFSSFLISNDYKQIIFISPLKQFAKQNLDRYIEYGYNKDNTLLVNSDGERDIEQVEKFIKDKKKFVISSTYCSVDIIYESLKYMNQKEVLIIVDEFHNISKTNMIDEEDNFNKILYSQYRILFMSATPRVYEMEDEEDESEETNKELFGEIVYNMTFTEAIEKKYITDYRIWLPSIHEDTDKLDNELSVYEIDLVIKAKCTFLFSCLLNNGSKKCIVYCIDNEEINKMREAIIKLNEFYALDYEMDQITASDSETKRTSILNKFETNNKIQILFSIRILDECIDIPKCDSIYITYPSQSKIRTIQRMCRCIRTDKNNRYKDGNVYIWCNEYDNILKTLSGIKEYDLYFKDKIKINETDFYGEKKSNGIEIDIKLIENYVLGIKEFRVLSWEKKLEEVKKYIDENGKRPAQQTKDKIISKMGGWISEKLIDYKNKLINDVNKYNKFKNFFENNKYSKYFLSNEDEWDYKLNKLKEYINNNNNIPYRTDTNIENSKLGRWIDTQIYNYKKKECIMINDIIRKKWEDFINDPLYNIYLKSNEDLWYDNFNNLKKYINENNKKPPSSSNNEYISRIGCWLITQIRNYKEEKFIMSNKKIKEDFQNFMNDKLYSKYLLSNTDEWKINLIKLKNYIDKYKKKPPITSKDEDIKQLGLWRSHQQQNYKKNSNIMKDKNIKIIWEEFINDEKYYRYMLDNEEIWNVKFNELKIYLDKYNKRPNKDNDLSKWLQHQITNYRKRKDIMHNNHIFMKWCEFINDQKYKKYFNTQII